MHSVRICWVCNALSMFGGSCAETSQTRALTRRLDGLQSITVHQHPVYARSFHIVSCCKNQVKRHVEAMIQLFLAGVDSFCKQSFSFLLVSLSKFSCLSMAAEIFPMSKSLSCAKNTMGWCHAEGHTFVFKVERI